MAGNQRLNATITIGGAVAASLSKSVGFVNRQLGGIGASFGAQQARLGAAIARNDVALNNARAGLVDAAGAYYALSAAIGAPVRAAMNFESAMADVTKVVDFGSAQGLRDFEQGLLDLTKRVPQTVDGLAQIAAAAGQSGIAAGDILEFTEAAAKIGTAFDISADEAGTAMAKLMTALNMTVGDAVVLTDAMNHLSNSQASTAAEILDVVHRTGSIGKLYGFAAAEVAAFGSAMIAAGAESEVASTSFMNMGRALTRGTSATGRQAAAMEKLGMNSEQVARDMQADATGTTLRVMEAIAALPAEMRAAVSSDLFGDEARALGPLLTNLDLVRESLGLVADESVYAGSAFGEYAAQSKTFANRLQLFNNAIARISVTIGDALLPVLTEAMNRIEPVIDALTQWIGKNPELVSGIFSVTAGLVAFRGAMAAVKFVGLLGKGGALHLLAAGMGTVGAAASRMGIAARSAVALQTALGAMDGKTLGVVQKIGIGLAGMVRAVPGVALLGKGIAAVGAAAATLSAPVWGLVAAAALVIGAAGATIYKYWDRISAVFSGVARAVGEILAPALDALRPALDWFAPLGGAIADGWNAAADAIGRAMEWIGSAFGREVLSEDSKAALEQSGYDMVKSVWDGLGRAFVDLHVWLIKKIDEIVVQPFRDAKAVVGGFFSNLIGGGDSGGAAAPIPTRAVGGSFPRGPVIVGERGPELRFENRAGFIATNRQMRDMGRAAEVMRGDTGQRVAQAATPSTINLGGIVINAAQGMDVIGIAREVERVIAQRLRGALYDGGVA